MNKIIKSNYFMVDYIFYDFLHNQIKVDSIRDYKLNSLANENIIVRTFYKKIAPIFFIVYFFVMRLFGQDKKNQCHTVIYFGIEDIHVLCELFIHNHHYKRHKLWLWNPVSSIGGRSSFSRFFFRMITLPTLKLIGIELWTFDIDDAVKFGLKYHNQIYADIHMNRYNKPVSECESAQRLFFIGQDKNRFNFLFKLKMSLDEFGIKNKFLVVKNRRQKYPVEGNSILSNKQISYFDYLKELSKSTCIIDIVQPGQTGLTLRSLEALFFKKKLITNNPSIAMFDFFNGNNIYILHNSSVDESLCSFLKMDMVKVDEAILKKYKLSHLISMMLK